MINKNLPLIIFDVFASLISLLFAFLVRFDFVVPVELIYVGAKWTPWFSIFQISIFNLMGLYARIWRYTSLFDLYAILKASIITMVFSYVFVLSTMGLEGYPRSVLLLYFIFNTLFVIGLRVSVRIYYSHYHSSSVINNLNPKKILMLIGAGKTGEKIAREIRTTSRNKYAMVGFVDDDHEKHGALIHGKKVYGSVGDLLNLKVKYDELVITAPSASGDQMRHIVEICKKTGKRYKTVPGISELIDQEEVTLDVVRDVAYTDLLGREEVKLDMNSMERLLKGKRVLITGAGGSIGSELVKQCLNFNPAEIICLDFNEEKIYSLEQFSNESFPKAIIKTVLASVTNKRECEKVFLENHPQIVFHAAAYKHVPIQETHPWKAVTVNVFGTLNLIELSDKYSVEKFVLVSTDKAVNPTNIMGATKRVAEKMIQSFNLISKTTLMAVRFGNVLGSSGSAIPTFQKQIQMGGPITITHPEMTRYFMSIPEASQLILQCGALGKDGEIFLLEMGRPIKIVEMAKDLIRLSGLEPDIDIPIVYTGLRPGEKLYEELQHLNEKKLNTTHKKIMVLKEKTSLIPWELLTSMLQSLFIHSKDLDGESIQKILKKILPTYKQLVFESTVETAPNYGMEGEA